MFPLKDNIPLARFPLATVALILANVVVYLLSIHHGGDFFGGPSQHVARHYGAIPAELTRPSRLQSAFSALFLHGSIGPLIADELALAIFAPSIEDATGRARFLAFYLLGGIIALALHVLLAPHSTIPALAAGGAVAAVLGGYLLSYPRARVVTLAPVPFFATILEVPAVLLLGLWLLAQLCFGLAGLADPVSGNWGLAYAALCAGLLAGIALIRPFLSATRRAAKAQRTPHRPVY